MSLQTVVSYPKRGKWGDYSYHGNCSGYLIKDLLEFFRPNKVYDPMAGSGTCGEVCQDLGIPYLQTDLNPEYGGVDILNEDVPTVADFIFWHPPYYNMVKYSGREWGNKPHTDDISRTNNYKDFINQLNKIQAKLIRSLRKGGRIAILIGDYYKNGKFYPIQKDIQWYGKPEKMIIKKQHNCKSDKNSYSNIIKTVHEYVLIFKRDNCYIIPARVMQPIQIDLRETTKLTWKDVVLSSLEKLGGKATLKDLYKEIKNHKKTEKNKNWKAKIRQTVQRYGEFNNIARGQYKLSS